MAFKRSWQSHYHTYEKNGQLSEEVKEDMRNRLELGNAMLQNYIKFSIRNDTNLTPVYTEIEFEVPIRVPKNLMMPRGFRAFDGRLEHLGIDDELNMPWYPVVYQGRIDLIVRDDQDRYWIVDHKTAARLEEDTSWLELDEQMKSYAWAIQHVLGINVAGTIYNELYKGIPQPPERLKTTRKGLSFSTNRQQDTTFELALETFRREDRAAFKAGLYDPYLIFLRDEGRTYIRRTRISYTQEMLQLLGDQICLEAIDMLNDPLVYPNPTKWGCKWCDFRIPCLALSDGQPIDWMKETLYTKRQSTPDKVSTNV